jgi:chromosome segregation ATPase
LPLEAKSKDESNREWHQKVESLRRHNAFLTQERDAQEAAIANQNSQLQAALEEAAAAKEKIQHERFKLQALVGDVERLKRESQHSETHLMRHTQQLESELERYKIESLQASEIQKSLESKVKDLRAAKDALSKCMDLPADELRQENIRLGQELQARDLKLDEQQQELGKFQMDKDLTEKALNDLKKAKLSADQEQAQMKEKMAELQVSTAEISRQKNTLQHKHDTMEAGKASLNQENIELKACVEDLLNAKNSLNHKYDTMKAGKASVDQENINLKVCVEDLRNAKNNLQHKYDTMKAGKASVDQENIGLKACVEELRNVKNSLNHEKTQMAKEIASHRLDKRNLEKAFETLENDLKAKFEQTKNALEAEKSHAGREKTSLSNRLTAANDENLMLKNSLQTMKSHQARVDHQGNDLRSRLELANNKIRSLEHQNSEWSSKIGSLNASHIQKDRAFAALQANKAQLDSEKDSLSQKLTTLNRTLESVKAQSQQATDALRREMEERCRQSEAKVREAAHAVGGHHTPRTVIFQKILSQARTSRDISEIPGASRFMEICTLSSLTNQYLDLPLSTKNAHKLGKSIRGDEMAITACNVCQLPKLARTNQAPRLRVDELGQKMQCCSVKICKLCILDGVVRSLLNDYWFELEKSVWVKCPSANCDASLNIRGRQELQATLQNLGDPNVAKHMAA